MQQHVLESRLGKGIIIALLCGAGLFAALLSGAVTQATAQSITTVTMSRDAFVPQTVTVPAGTTVLWLNSDTHYHSVTSDTGMFDSGTMYQNNSYQFTFLTPGTYYYYCRFHGSARSGMWGVVIVTGSTYGNQYYNPYQGGTAYNPHATTYNPYASGSTYNPYSMSGYTYPYSTSAYYPATSANTYPYSGYSGYTPVTSSYSYPYSGYAGYTPVSTAASTYYPTTSYTSPYYTTAATWPAQTYGGTGYGSSYTYPYTSSSSYYPYHASLPSSFRLNCSSSAYPYTYSYSWYASSYLCQMGW